VSDDLAVYRIAVKFAGLDPLTQPSSATVAAALNSIMVVRAAFLNSVAMEEGRVSDIPPGPDRDLLHTLAQKSGYEDEPGSTSLIALAGANPVSPLVAFCLAHELDPCSMRGLLLYAAHAIPLSKTTLGGRSQTLRWLDEQGITTVGELAAKSEAWWNETEDRRRRRKPMSVFLSEQHPWTAVEEVAA
jgi:hypothetical protein